MTWLFNFIINSIKAGLHRRLFFTATLKKVVQYKLHTTKITFFEGHFLTAKGLCYIIAQNKSPNFVNFALNSFCQGDMKAML